MCRNNVMYALCMAKCFWLKKYAPKEFYELSLKAFNNLYFSSIFNKNNLVINSLDIYNSNFYLTKKT